MRSVSLCDIGANLITIRIVTCLLSVAGMFRIDDCRSCPLLLVATVTVVVVIVARTGRAVLQPHGGGKDGQSANCQC